MGYFLKRLKLIILFFTISQFSIAQSGYYKVHEFPTAVGGQQIISFENRNFVVSAKICDFGNFYTECSFLNEIDEKGEFIWTAELPELDVGTKTMCLYKDQIIVTGNNNPIQDRFYMARFSKDGDRLGFHEILHPTGGLAPMYQQVTTVYNDDLVLVSTGRRNDSMFTFLLVVDTLGNVKRDITIQKVKWTSIAWTMFVDSKNLLTFMLELAGNPGEDHRKIIQYNPDFEVVWSLTTPFTRPDRINPYGNELHDGRLIMACNVKNDTYQIGGVCCYNRDSTLSWHFEQPYNHALERFIYRLKVTRNGDIVGCGVYSNQKYDPIIRRSPFFFRMSPDGEMLWERVYFDINSIDGESRNGNFLDIEELEDGGFLLTGRTRNQTLDLLIVRTDSTGCIDPGCGEVNILDLTSDTEDVDKEENKVVIFPNPMSDEGFSVYIKDFEQNQNYSIKVYNYLGNVMFSDKISQRLSNISTDWHAGIYFVEISKDGHALLKEKLIKL
ncbi:MAG: T9SS type A sorting domain-containing protein [Saprospiraceae bacterium]